MALINACSEGEMFLWENTLVAKGDDDRRRGSVHLETGDQMLRTWTGVDDLWVRVRVATQNISGLNSFTMLPYVQLRDSTADPMIQVQNDGTQSQGSLCRNQVRRKQTEAGSVTAFSEIFTVNLEEFYNLDIRVQRSTVTNPNDTLTYSVYVNQVLRYQETNTDASGWSQPTQLLIQGGSTSTTPDSVWIQDVIISDSVPTVGMELVTMYPSSAGTYSAFTNDYTNIDEAGYDSSDNISTASLADRESWGLTAEPFTIGDKVIYAVVTNTVAQLDIAGTINDFQPFLRLSATNYAASNIGADAIAADSYLSIWTTNPDTAALWQSGDLSGMESGVLSV